MGDNQYDLSPYELDKIRRRREIRERLRHEFNKKYFNPYNSAYRVVPTDPMVQRFMAARVSFYDYWKPSWRSFFQWFGLQVAPVIVFTVLVTYERKNREKKYKSGEISYEERDKPAFVY
ncbi:hypothetical protein B4U79_04276 [Dinothrombium tinctorium]|uniref:NADH dehydrogenase [ubiquinone] 1 beta subcomplex subunit 4 n=1 Tax=Dinothrombium tinctorium TaxID=1965070 RepID=A0A443QNB6_9ACAR|nr:hypothetical protein B4U79_04276 [Dinothrombium tinctorium]